MRIAVDFLNSSRQRSIRCAVLSLLGLLALVGTPVVRAETVLGASPAIRVTDEDIKAAAEVIPLAARGAALSRRENVNQQVEGVYLRRALSEEAVREGLDKDPVVVALIKLGRERILSEARLSALDLSRTPDSATLDSYAEASYKGDPKRFEVAAQTRVRHILLRKDAPDAKAKAEALLAELKAGASFETLAKERSADYETAAQGGDLGFFSEGAMVKPFEDAVAALKAPGDLSGVVETQYGYHVVRLEARRPAGMRPFSEVRDLLRIEARSRAHREARAEKINKLMEQLKIDPAAVEEFTKQYR